MTKMDNLRILSLISETNIPLVLFSYQPLQIETTLGIAEARKLAIALIQAVTIAEHEKRLIDLLIPETKFKGFSKNSAKSQKKANQEQTTAHILHALRQARPESAHPNVKPIFGYKTKQAIIEYFIDGTKLQLTPEEAMHHAKGLLQVCEAAERDAFFYKFGEKFKMKRADIQAMLQEMSAYRKINELEGLI